MVISRLRRIRDDFRGRSSIRVGWDGTMGFQMGGVSNVRLEEL